MGEGWGLPHTGHCASGCATTPRQGPGARGHGSPRSVVGGHILSTEGLGRESELAAWAGMGAWQRSAHTPALLSSHQACLLETSYWLIQKNPSSTLPPSFQQPGHAESWSRSSRAGKALRMQGDSPGPAVLNSVTSSVTNSVTSSTGQG